MAVEPRKAPAHAIRLGPEERQRVRDAVAASSLGRSELIAALASKRVLLVGETHFREEEPAWLCGLLGDLHEADRRQTVLLLELPQRSQPPIDRFLATGDEVALENAFGFDALPYQSIVRWARTHPESVSRVVAYDENPWRTIGMRLLATDTRNETMARAIAEAAQATPGGRVVAYGGRLHMMNAGRYLYDSDTRRPIGARLPGHGLPRSDIATVWLFPDGAVADGAWDNAGTVALDRPAGSLPIAQVEDSPVFGVTRFGDVADYAVHLAALTPRP